MKKSSSKAWKGEFVEPTHWELDADPLRQFDLWFEDAKRAGNRLPEALTLATASKSGAPCARVILLKQVSRGDFLFFTNYESRKAQDLAANPRATMIFHWGEIERQVSIEGVLKKTTRAESVAYFDTRPRDSRLGAWASAQSQPIASRTELDARFDEARIRFEGSERVPCPKYWGGYRLTPLAIEFWQGRHGRLHDRWLFVREGKPIRKAARWKRAILCP